MEDQAGVGERSKAELHRCPCHRPRHGFELDKRGPDESCDLEVGQRMNLLTVFSRSVEGTVAGKGTIMLVTCPSSLNAGDISSKTNTWPISNTEC